MLIAQASLAIFMHTAQASPPTVAQAVVLQAPVKAVKNSDIQHKINLLIKCESGGRNVTVMDTNGKYSAGILQFQLATFQGYRKKYGLDPDKKLWKDSEIQRDLAYRMLEESPKNVRHWTNCAKAKGIYQ